MCKTNGLTCHCIGLNRDPNCLMHIIIGPGTLPIRDIPIILDEAPLFFGKLKTRARKKLNHIMSQAGYNKV